MITFLLLACYGFGVYPASAGETLRVVSAAPHQELNRLFQTTSGWIGADGNYSVELSPEKRLWFFSDTLLGDIRNGRRQNMRMINNSVGVHTLSQNGDRVDFFWNNTRPTEPAALFAPADGRGWLWPFAGLMVEGRLQLFFMQMEKATGPAGFGFRNVVVWLDEIANPADSPTTWRTTHRKVPHTLLGDKRRLLFGSAVLRHGAFIYIYGVEEHPQEKLATKGLVVARVPAAEFTRFEAWRFFTGHKWTPEFEKAAPLVSGVASEYSVSHVAALDQFICVTHDAFLSPRIVARTAPEPWGPWSPPVTLYTSPEAESGSKTFCYSGKAHNNLGDPRELVLTYAANPSDLSGLAANPQLYWPRFVRVKLQDNR